MKKIFLLVIITLIGLRSLIIVPVEAARYLVSNTPPLSLSEITQLKSQSNYYRDLTPLPWIIVDIAMPPLRKKITIIKTISSRLQPDIIGYFAASSTKATAKPDDLRYNEQWYLTSIGVSAFWEQIQGEGTIIALLDTGVDPHHPDLANNILFASGYDFGDADAEPYDQHGHGTAMAGLMIAECGNQIGICGVAPVAKIIPYKINRQDQSSFLATDLAQAILAAADSPAQIISLSLYLTNESPVVQAALDYALAQGKMIVAAAGNRGEAVAYPAYLPWVIGVGALDKQGQRLFSSNYGNGLTLMAPGTDLLSTLPGGGYSTGYEDTSAATALVAGVLALMTAQQPTATAAQHLVKLVAASQDINLPGFDEETGFGQLKAPVSILNVPLDTFQSEKPWLKLQPVNAEVFSPGEEFKLDLFFYQVGGLAVDLYLRMNYPTLNETRRHNSYKIWNSQDSNEAIPYNYPLASPYFLTGDFYLPLYGDANALLGFGKIPTNHDVTEGIYELLALLTTANNHQIWTRKIIGITKTTEKFDD